MVEPNTETHLGWSSDREADCIFFNAVARTPEAIALEAGTPGAAGARRLSYAALAAEVRSHAIWLRTLGKPGVLAALTGNPAWSVPGLLAALDAGWTWLPLDPAWPAARLAAVVAAAEPAALLVEPGQMVAGGVLELPETRVRRLDANPLKAGPFEAEATEIQAAAANLFFTSGTTGQPKGILGRRGALAHYVAWQAQLLADAGLPLGPELRVSALAPTTFDASLRDAALPLSVGGTVCVPPDRGVFADGERLGAWLKSARVAVVHTVPTVFRGFLAAAERDGTWPHLRAVLLAGEALRPSDVSRFFEVFGDSVALFNLYGPTEATMTRLWHRVTPADAMGPTVPLGRAMADTEVFVVDTAGRTRPPGRPGEIVLRSPWISLGYLDNAAENDRAFVPDLLGDGVALPVYRTGDLGVLRTDGVVEFRGRRDHQVKLRGVRIELEEIEAALGSAPGVREAAAALRDGADGEPRLVAWAAGDGDFQAWLDHLRVLLPASAVPARIVVVPALPRLLNGKIDRSVLQLPPESTSAGVPLDGDMERQVAAVFAEVLGASWGSGALNLGATDDFFSLGGDSLQTLQALWRLNEVLGCELPVDLIYQARTVRGVAAYAAARAEAAGPTEARPDQTSARATAPLFETLQMTRGSGRPIWWLPPAYGLSLPYRGLVDSAGAGQGLARPSWALERLLGPDASAARSVEALAEAACAALKTKQAEGPWSLVGWSFGGVLAWETARQLCATHGPTAVDRVVLLDSAAPGSGFDFTAGDAQTAALAVRRLGQLLRRDLSLEPATLLGLGAEDLARRVIELAAESGLPMTPSLRQHALSVVSLRTAALAALEGWRPSPWIGPNAAAGAAPPIWILRATDSETDWTAGWSLLAAGPRVRRTVTGDHFSMLEPPHAAALLATIQEALSEAQGVDCEG